MISCISAVVSQPSHSLSFRLTYQIGFTLLSHFTVKTNLILTWFKCQNSFVNILLHNLIALLHSMCCCTQLVVRAVLICTVADLSGIHASTHCLHVYKPHPQRMFCTIALLVYSCNITSVMIYHRGASLSEQHMHWFTMHKAGFVTHK